MPALAPGRAILTTGGVARYVVVCSLGRRARYQVFA